MPQAETDQKLDRRFDRAYRAGQTAQEVGKGQEHCPFAPDSWDAEIWLLGWDEAEADKEMDQWHEKGWEVAALDLVWPLPQIKTRLQGRLQEAYLDGLLAAYGQDSNSERLRC